MVFPSSSPWGYLARVNITGSSALSYPYAVMCTLYVGWLIFLIYCAVKPPRWREDRHVMRLMIRETTRITAWTSTEEDQCTLPKDSALTELKFLEETRELVWTPPEEGLCTLPEDSVLTTCDFLSPRLLLVTQVYRKVHPFNS